MNSKKKKKGTRHLGGGKKGEWPAGMTLSGVLGYGAGAGKRRPKHIKGVGGGDLGGVKG